MSHQSSRARYIGMWQLWRKGLTSAAVEHSILPIITMSLCFEHMSFNLPTTCGLCWWHNPMTTVGWAERARIIIIRCNTCYHLEHTVINMLHQTRFNNFNCVGLLGYNNSPDFYGLTTTAAKAGRFVAVGGRVSKFDQHRHLNCPLAMKAAVHI